MKAYQLGLYGPRIVWIFSNPGDIVNIADSDSCTLENRKEFEQGAFYNFIEVDDTENWPLSMGLTGSEYKSLISKRVPNYESSPLKAFAHTCFDTISALVALLDATEQRLQANGNTFRQLIANPAMDGDLEKTIKEAIYDMDINLYSGRVKYQKGEHRVVFGSGFKQSQNTGRVVVFHDSANNEDPNRYKYPNGMVWRTPDGKTPRAKPRVVIEMAKIHPAIVGIFLTIAAFIGVGLIVATIWPVTVERHNQALKLTSIEHFGMLLIEIIIFIYPLVDRLLFCKLAPILAIYGFFLLFWTISIRLHQKPESNENKMKRSIWKPFHINAMGIGRSRVNTLETPPKLEKTIRPRAKTASSQTFRARAGTTDSQLSREVLDVQITKKQMVVFATMLSLMTVLVLIWYTTAGSPIVEAIFEENYDFKSDTLTKTKFEHCSSENTLSVGLFSVLAGILACLLVYIIVSAFSKKADKNIVKKYAILTTYCVAPSTVAMVLLIAINLYMDITYYVVFLIIQVNILAVLVFAKKLSDQLKGERQPV